MLNDAKHRQFTTQHEKAKWILKQELYHLFGKVIDHKGRWDCRPMICTDFIDIKDENIMNCFLPLTSICECDLNGNDIKETNDNDRQVKKYVYISKIAEYKISKDIPNQLVAAR